MTRSILNFVLIVSLMASTISLMAQGDHETIKSRTTTQKDSTKGKAATTNTVVKKNSDKDADKKDARTKGTTGASGGQGTRIGSGTNNPNSGTDPNGSGK